MAATRDEIWLEVSNIKVTSATTFEVQLRADRGADRESEWWSAPAAGGVAEFKVIADALEKKRPVLAQLKAGANNVLEIVALSIQYVEASR